MIMYIKACTLKKHVYLLNIRRSIFWIRPNMATRIAMLFLRYSRTCTEIRLREGVGVWGGSIQSKNLPPPPRGSVKYTKFGEYFTYYAVSPWLGPEFCVML